MSQLLFGRFYWVWIVAFLGTSGYLGYVSVSQLLSLSNTKKYKMPKLKRVTFRDARKLSKNVILRGTNIFDPNGGMVSGTKKTKKTKTKVEKPKKSTAKPTVEGCPAIEADQKIPESKVRTIRLKGTSYVEKDPGQSVAAVFVKVKQKRAAPTRRRRTRRRRSKKRRRRKKRRRYYRRTSGRWRWQTEIFRVGDLMMQKMRVCVITPTEIVFYHQRKLQKLSLVKKKRKRKLRYYGSLGIPRPKDDNNGPGQVRIDAVDKRTISRKTVQDWLQNPMAHATSARIMPVRTGGLRLVWVRKKSLYAQLGLKTGDTVLSVNGKKLNVSNALGLYSQLPYAKNLKVNVVRRGVRRQLFFNIK